MDSTKVPAAKPVKKKGLSGKNLLLGAAIQTFEVSTLGQPFEVVKTQMAANRDQNLRQAVKATYARGGMKGFYQGLFPWALIEASTKGGILLFASSEVEGFMTNVFHAGPVAAGLVGGMMGGVAQAYTTMGFCTFMKTVEVTRRKVVGEKPLSTFTVARNVFEKEGIRGLNRGVSAVAIRQMTNWGSRFGISRLTETLFKRGDKDYKLSNAERLMSSVVGGALSTWNQPIEVIRIEMQSQLKVPGRPENASVIGTAKYIYQTNGILGFYRGVTPRIMLGVYLTTCMVFGGDKLKEYFA
ncbi:Citrate/oxoglutarate carrier protein [Smittium mucronatum]|uniref:Citrate/oxoglutarate carrier protein n=1 Tax=Smittium mucronatum TaxID=133383 RepID=A0A1R0H571_9FUNG|nr:Citrate/oxoglutarate carrier protein [Smittium mucronatum]